MGCNGIGMYFCHCGGDICNCGIDGSPCDGCEDCDFYDEPDFCDFCEGISTDPRLCDCGYVENVGTFGAANSAISAALNTTECPPNEPLL